MKTGVVMPSIEQIQEAILIRTIENKFLDLFSEGKLNGTVHTCVGQEFSAIAFAGQLLKSDYIVSNHRCHGHYISFTGDSKGLLAELLGKVSGTCGGVGSSQHLKRDNFFSNGIQGGIVPISAGIALASKLNGSNDVVVVFIGDGTLGEGVVYETLNLASLWKLPLLIVCENNHYAQSTRVEDALAGGILERAESFGIRSFSSTTENVDQLISAASESIEKVRKEGVPVFHLVDTYRLNAHSKGDDDRNPEDIKSHTSKDFLTVFESEDHELYQELKMKAVELTEGWVSEINLDDSLSFEEYISAEPVSAKPIRWHALENLGQRQVALINQFFDNWLSRDKRNIFLGEDVLSPYGGAFKVANNLSFRFPDQVLSTPISEAAITGVANGLALSGFRPVVEIMFGDFITLAMDQIINHASKFYHMYNHQVNCPVVIRTPMGGRRGYGPTHSQSLERFLIGIDNVTVVALNTLISPELILETVFESEHPVIVIENKVDYGKTIGPPYIENYVAERSNDPYPVVRVHPRLSESFITIVTYGGAANIVLGALPELFRRFELTFDVLVLSCINPVDYREILNSLEITKKLVVIEEGSTTGGVASEIVSSVQERIPFPVESMRIGAEPFPIPSIRNLEERVLPSTRRIIELIAERFA
jgi:2-oxoisovalerate dehydrogenase E1 component